MGHHQTGAMTLKAGVPEWGFYNDLPAEEAKHHASLLKSHSAG